MLLGNALVEFLDRLFSLLHKYVMEVIILMFMVLFVLWTIGYLANPLYGYKFDLQSCWGGFSAIGGAGVLAAIKYSMDSWKNTPEGIAPNYASTGLIQKVTDTITTFSKQNGNTVKEERKTETTENSRGGR